MPYTPPHFRQTLHPTLIKATASDRVDTVAAGTTAGGGSSILAMARCVRRLQRDVALREPLTAETRALNASAQGPGSTDMGNPPFTLGKGNTLFAHKASLSVRRHRAAPFRVHTDYSNPRRRSPLVSRWSGMAAQPPEPAAVTMAHQSLTPSGWWAFFFCSSQEPVLATVGQRDALPTQAASVVEGR